MKDCTFTVEVNGKRVTYDYDGIRAFLMDKKNLAAVAPVFHSGQSSGKKEATKPVPRAESVPISSLPVDELYGKVTDRNANPAEGPVPSKSKYETGQEVRKALEAADMDFAKERKRLYAEMSAAREPLLTVSRKRTKDQEKELEGKFLAAKDAYDDAMTQHRLNLLYLTAPGGLADITWNPVKVEEELIKTGKYESTIETETEGDFEPNIAKAVQFGVDYFRVIVGDHPALKGQNIVFRYFGKQPEQRAFFSGKHDEKPSYVELSKSDIKTSVIVHELGHWLEYSSPKIQKRVAKFLKRRAGREVPRRLAELTGNKRFREGEIAVEDKFRTPYIGKYYTANPRKQVNWDDVYASEVVSMGVQYMYENPVDFAREDPDMFDLIHDILREGR